MRTKIIVILLFCLLVALGGCSTEIGIVSEPNNPSPSCSLSPLGIKSVTIEGDKDNFLARTLKAELYKKGARYSEDGMEIIGSAYWDGAFATEISVEAKNMSFASTKKLLLNRVKKNWDIETSIARMVVKDFCECFGATTTPKKE